ncbi:MAG: sigma-54 interaction domain-containing protein [Chitinophagales bacterium]
MGGISLFKLSEVPDRYLRIIETIFNEFDGALVIDEKGIIRIFTDYYARETNLNKEDVIGRRVDEVFPTTRMLEVLKTGKPIIADLWVLGDKAQIVSRVPITANGQIIGAAGFNVFRYLNDARHFADRISNMFSELKYYKEQVQILSSSKYSLASIIGESEAILEAKDRIRAVANSNVAVCIYGETGTGKELFAHALHWEGNRREYPLVRVNCAAIPDNMVESELFGYDEGAFTGARRKGKPGKFELAHRGSIFLDEIAELSAESQARLLRVIQEKEFERLGGTRTISVDVRIISASNVPLTKRVSENRFRKDLFFRLETFPIVIPPLRERKEDIKPLCEHFINLYNRDTGDHIEGIDAGALATLNGYHWPGNVRELYAVLERACIDAREGIIRTNNLTRFNPSTPKREHYQGFDLQKARQEAEKQTILRALQASGSNRTRAAEMLGLSRSALYNKLNEYQMLDKD